MTGFRSSLSTAPWADTPIGGLSAGSVRSAETGGLAGGRVPGGRRRSVPHLLVGALLVVTCAVGFAVATGSLDHRASVLALGRAVTAGQRLSGADVRVVRVSIEAGVATIPASARDTVIGQTAAVSLPAGALLTRSELGAVDVPSGQAVVAVAVKPGQAPPDLAAGEHVLVVPVSIGTGGSTGTGGDPAAGSGSVSARSTSQGASAAPWTGVVTGVVPATDARDSTVVSVQLPTAVARVVAALPAGQVGLVLVPGS